MIESEMMTKADPEKSPSICGVQQSLKINRVKIKQREAAKLLLPRIKAHNRKILCLAKV
jgi:hypothetical protein